MQKLMPIIAVFCLASVMGVGAQPGKGKILFGASTALGLLGTQMEVMSLKFGTLKYKSDADVCSVRQGCLSGWCRHRA